MSEVPLTGGTFPLPSSSGESLLPRRIRLALLEGFWKRLNKPFKIIILESL